jgi:spore germination protein YaaH
MVDFESFPANGQPGYLALLQELSGDLHARGMKLYVAVPPHNGEYDYPAIAAAADGVVLMNYDEHFPGAASGPVASQDWFVQNLNFSKSVIPQEKIICAIANYGSRGSRRHRQHAGGVAGRPRFRRGRQL